MEPAQEMVQFHELPTLYPSANWIVAYGYTLRIDDVRKQLDVFNTNERIIKTVTTPSWVHFDVKKGVEVMITEPIFPGYFFIDLRCPKTDWGCLDEIEGISKVLITSVNKKEPETPYRLTPFEVAHIMQLTATSLDLVEPESYKLLGSEVIITDGLFKDFQGTVVEDGHTIRVEVKLKNRAFAIRIERHKVAKII